VTAQTTLVIAPDIASAQKAAANAKTPIGTWQWIPATTLHDAVYQLGRVAGLAIELRIPDVQIQATVIDPSKSIWTAIKTLCEATFAPEYYFRRTEDRVIIADRVGESQGVGSSIAISTQMVDQAKGITAGPYTIFGVPIYVRRVIFGVDAWL
jgi:hypothetical protein